MKPPQFALWVFAQLGARSGDQLADLYPGSGAVSEAWRRHTPGERRAWVRGGAGATRRRRCPRAAVAFWEAGGMKPIARRAPAGWAAGPGDRSRRSASSWRRRVALLGDPWQQSAVG